MGSLDYLSLRSENSPAYSKVTDLFKSQNETPVMQSVFSDYMKRYDASLKKTKYVIVLTNRSLYGLKISSIAMQFRYPIDYIEKITLITTSPSLLALTFKGQEIDLKRSGGNISTNFNELSEDGKGKQHEIVLETVKRTEFLLFLITCFDSKSKRRPKIEFSKKVQIHAKKSQQVKEIEVDPTKQGLSKESQKLMNA